jgi:hypothetical protein
MIKYAAALLGLIFLTNISYSQQMPVSRITSDSIDLRLYTARDIVQKYGIRSAVREIKAQLKADPSLVTDAAILLGGNYHLERLTDNVFADRVGGFSPSGKKLAYSRDTSLLRLDDGLFDWYENRTTGVFYYDFAKNEEITPDIPYANAFAPRFLDDSTLLFMVADDTAGGKSAALYKYDLELGQTSECFPITSRSYCTSGGKIIVYDNTNGEIKKMNPEGKIEQMLFDNTDFFSFKRPLSFIWNLSACDQEIYFQSGFGSGRSGENIYSMPSGGGRPRIRTSEMQEFAGSGRFYPAAIDSDEFLFLANYGKDVEIYYQYKDKEYCLTYDGGDKFYLAVSPDLQRIAYSYMPLDQGVESYEIFILDFSRDATPDDIEYRFKTLQ